MAALPKLQLCFFEPFLAFAKLGHKYKKSPRQQIKRTLSKANRPISEIARDIRELVVYVMLRRYSALLPMQRAQAQRLARQ